MIQIITQVIKTVNLIDYNNGVICLFITNEQRGKKPEIESYQFLRKDDYPEDILFSIADDVILAYGVISTYHYISDLNSKLTGDLSLLLEYEPMTVEQLVHFNAFDEIYHLHSLNTQVVTTILQNI